MYYASEDKAIAAALKLAADLGCAVVSRETYESSAAGGNGVTCYEITEDGALAIADEEYDLLTRKTHVYVSYSVGVNTPYRVRLLPGYDAASRAYMDF